ncbi:MAG: hypothetical protein HY665_04040 [Chloroflexi bacterium]|nr:hypothetical protein [Chloroflexota bacterium]
MGELRVDIPNDIHKALRKIAVDENSSLKQLVVNVLHDYLEAKSKSNVASVDGDSRPER